MRFRMTGVRDGTPAVVPDGAGGADPESIVGGLVMDPEQKHFGMTRVGDS
jgi:hypothetical protein